MKVPMIIMAGAVLCVVVASSGCMSTEAKRLKRIDKNQQLFAIASAEQKTLIKKGDIDVGFTEDMVLLSWGKPDYAFDRVAKDGRSRIWKYTSHRSRPSWEHATVPVTFRDGKGRYRTTYQTVTVDRTHHEEYLTAIVEFVEGEVVAFDVQSNEQPDI